MQVEEAAMSTTVTQNTKNIHIYKNKVMKKLEKKLFYENKVIKLTFYK